MDKLKTTCEQLHITQKQLAQMLDINENTFSQWKRNGKMPKWADKLLDLLIIEQRYNTIKEFFLQTNEAESK